MEACPGKNLRKEAEMKRSKITLYMNEPMGKW